MRRNTCSSTIAKKVVVLTYWSTATFVYHGIHGVLFVDVLVFPASECLLISFGKGFIMVLQMPYIDI